MEITALQVEIKVPIKLSAAKVEQILDEEDVSRGDLEEDTEVNQIVEGYIGRNITAFISDPASKATAEVIG